MGAWVRGGEPPDEIKVTFVVNARKDPELAAWLWALPYRGTSASVRDILSAAARLLSRPAPDASQAAASLDSAASIASIQMGANHPHKKPAALAQPPMHDASVGSDAESPEGMTDAVAKLMREMDDEF
jgi:predicted component of type VI protein secretion system